MSGKQIDGRISRAGQSYPTIFDYIYRPHELDDLLSVILNVAALDNLKLI